MPWLRFTADFPFHVKPTVTMMYREGDVKLVTRACADQAIAKNCAAATERPSADPEVNNAGR